MGQLVSNLKWLVGKGYIGHEHLPEFRLVNMQGRLYDPVLCRFLSPDPYVQEPDNSQNLNRYSYCFNNPMADTDPSGLLSEQSLNYLVELALKRGRNYIWDEGLFTTIRFEGWGGSPTTFGDYGCILSGLSNGTAVVNISANYGYSYLGPRPQEALKAFGNIPNGFLTGVTISNMPKLVGYDVSVVNFGGGDLRKGGSDIVDGFAFLASITSMGFESKASKIYNVHGWKNKSGRYFSSDLLKKRSNGKYVRGVQGYRNSAMLAKKTSQTLKSTGKAFGVLGVGITVVDAFSDGNFTCGDGAKVGIGLLTTFTPIGWGYGLLDLGTYVMTGTSITDRVGNYIDEL